MAGLNIIYAGYLKGIRVRHNRIFVQIIIMKKNKFNQGKRLKAVGVIPVRYDSHRFKGKVLADLLGKPMIQHVWEKARKSVLLDDLIVAADNERIIDAVRSFGGKAVLTSKKHPSGTDRVHEAVQFLKTDIVINIQSDEPMLVPSMVDDLITALSGDEKFFMATFRKTINDPDLIRDPNTVKVIVDKNDFAIYFSRTPLPFYRNDSMPKTYYKHIGLYGYTKEFLSVFSRLPVSFLETSEGLEQLRALENGFKIKVLETQHDTIGVDTPKDLETVRLKLSTD
jgi:3-deoxy-manno-octulosonate cytidylyltransferase (CMP-KDO synthetase)